MTEPLISVIIPVYNCEQYLAAAVESVLGQTYQTIEVIVIDDGSSDRSGAVAQSFGKAIVYHKIDHSGGATALNHGVDLSQGEYLAFLDADDLWVEDKLTWQMAALSQDSELEAVFGQVEQFISPEIDLNTTNLTIQTKVSPAYHKDTLLIRRQSFEQIGRFNAQFQLVDFIEWYLRATEQGLNSLMLPQILAKRRLHQTNTTLRLPQYRVEYARVLKASLDRRRKLGKVSTDNNP
ncbi:MAG: glycosyltransferase family A protein [Cyanobacteria bacterium J06643_13]